MTACNVLLVDDEVEFITSLAERLRLRGIAAKTATSGQAALNLMEAEFFHVVVLDVMMPGMDGLETLKAIKSRHPPTEVILLTAHACLDAALTGIESGAFDYLAKPVDIDELSFKLQDAFEKACLNPKSQSSCETLTTNN
ncbi:MAG: response regulator [Thermodesulfobacteriota bacterium]